MATTGKVVDVIFSDTNRNTDVVEKFFTRVDVSEEYRSWSRNCHRTMTAKPEDEGIE